MMRNVSCLVVLLAAAGCSGRKGKPDRPAVPVTIAPVRRMSLPYTLMANGLVTPLQTAIVAPQVDGIITEVSFREGQNVSPGQVLFQIEAQPYVAAYQQAQAMLARDSATAANARRDADRYDQLEQTDYVTKEQAEQQRATAAAAEGTAAADRAALATAKFNLDKTTIRAPIPGRTGSLLVRVGNVVHAAGATPLVVIDQIKPILVRFAVPGTELPLIQQYGARGALPVTATIGAATGGSQPPRDPSADPLGALSFIDNAVDTTTGTLMLKATFPNTTGTLWPGQFVSVSLRLFDEQNALVVPAPAVLTGQQGTYVYVVDSAGSAQQRAVTVERTAEGMSVIAAGLSDGDRVVSEGQSRLTPGAKVTGRAGADSTAAPGTGGGRRRAR